MLRQQLTMGGSAPAPTTTRQGLILQELARDEAAVTFTGLRRRLGIHPQALTRELRRLQEQALIEQTRQGYRIRDDATTQIANEPTKDQPNEILRLVLPPDTDTPALADALAGRWFQNLRWYGRSDGPGEHTLVWLTDNDQRLVRIRLVGGLLLIEAQEPGPGLATLMAAVAQAL